MAELTTSFNAKKTILLVLILLFLAFGCGFASGLLTGIWATRTETKKPCHPLDVC